MGTWSTSSCAEFLPRPSVPSVVTVQNIGQKASFYCTCGICLVPTENTKRLAKAKFDTPSIPYFVVQQGSRHGASCGKLMRSASIAKRRIVQRKLRCTEITRSSSDSNSRIRTENLNMLGQIANEDNSYIATWYERQRYENNWKLAFECSRQECTQ